MKEKQDLTTSSLHVAAEQGDIEKIKTLIAENIDPLIPNNHGKLPIEVAKLFVLSQIQLAVLGYKEAYEIYLKQKEESSIPSHEDLEKTPIGFMIILEDYTERRKKMIIDSFFEAAKTGNEEEIRRIYKEHIEQGRWLDIDIKDHKNSTAIQYTAYHNHINCFNFLKSKGSKGKIIISKNNAKISMRLPLSKNFPIKAMQMYDYAEGGLKKELVKIFGSANHIICKDGKAPIHITTQKGHYECLKYFLLKSIPIDLRDENGFSPLHYAILYNREACFNLLLDQGANINVQSNNGNTPLHFAVENDREYYLHALLFKKVNLDILNNDKLSPLDLANQLGKPKYFRTMQNFLSRNQKLESMSEFASDSDQKKLMEAQSITPTQKNTASKSYKQKLNRQSYNEIKSVMENLYPQKESKEIISEKLNAKTDNPSFEFDNNTCVDLQMCEYDAAEYRINKEVLPQSVLELLMFAHASLETPVKIFLTGGAVRTFVYNFFYKQHKPPKDYDLIADLPINTMQNIFSKHSPSTCLIQGHPNQSLKISLKDTEVDVSFFDNNIYGSNLLANLQYNAFKRDAPINAMFYDPVKEKVYHLPKAVNDFKTKSLTTFRKLNSLLCSEPSILFRLLRIANEIEFTFIKADDNLTQLIRDIIAGSNFYYPKFYKELLTFFNSCIEKNNKNKTLGMIEAVKVLDKYNLNISLAGAQDKYLKINKHNDATIDIFEAANKNDVAALQYAFHQNLDFNQRNMEQETPLSQAIKCGSVESCCYLIMAGASIQQALEMFDEEVVYSNNNQPTCC